MYAEGPQHDEVVRLKGWTLLDFGTDWCGHCQQAAPWVAALVAASPERGAPLRHLGVEDGRGKPLGRAFGVKLWPTLVLLHDGIERARVVRPRNGTDLAPLVAALRADLT